MTLRTLADVGYALGCAFSINACSHADFLRTPEPRWLADTLRRHALKPAGRLM